MVDTAKTDPWGPLLALVWPEGGSVRNFFELLSSLRHNVVCLSSGLKLT
jgi:hypothetical protein